MKIEVRTYHGRTQADAAQIFAADAAVLTPLGYQPTSQSWAEGRSGCLRVILMGFVFAFFFRPPGTLSVTYTYNGPDPAPEVPPLVEPGGGPSTAQFVAIVVIVIVVLIVLAEAGSR